jgi:hydroxymethylglutaryl-CoA synthase
MSNIISYGVSVPRFRIENQILHPQLGKKQGKHAVAFVDEDILTLAFDAANKCLSRVHSEAQIDAILFASTTPVFKDRYHASFVAEWLDLPKGILALDLCASSRSGSDALLVAERLLQTGQYHNVLVLAADTFFPPIGDELKVPFGHAGCAVLLGDAGGFATVKSAQTYSSFIAEEFEYRGGEVRLDTRFARDAGFMSNLSMALKDFMDKGKSAAGDFSAVILNSHFSRNAVGLFKKAGFDIETQVFMDSVQPQIGYTRACHGLLYLIDCLEKKSGNILFIDYSNGTNVFCIEREAKSTGVKVFEPRLRSEEAIESYQDYLLLQKAATLDLQAHGQEIFASEIMLEREKENILHLKGFECKNCKSVYFIKAQRCSNCHGEEFSEKRLARTGTIFTFTKEHYFPASFPPVTMVVVDLDGGGRITVQVTDEMYPHKMPESLIGAKVELVLRKMVENDAKPDYFWKCQIVE